MAQSPHPSNVQPLLYHGAVEEIDDDEAETTRRLVETMQQITETTHAHYGHAVRSVHAKSIGLISGELTVHPGLPPHYAQGLFAHPTTHPVVLRFSTAPGDLIDDSISTPRGLAIKVADVPGPQLSLQDGAATQDFVLINGPAFVSPGPKAFLANLKLLAASTDKAEAGKKLISSMLRGTEALMEAFGGQSSTLKNLGGHPLTHPLGETFYSMTPFRYGDYIAKFAVAPLSGALTALTGQPVDLAGSPDGLREHLQTFFQGSGGEWALKVQLCTDLEQMPVEDASVVWPEDQSPYVQVATIRVAPQTAWSPARAALVDDGLAFSPWQGLEAHQPLGAVNRARKPAYRMSAQFRAGQNRCPILHQPPASLPD